MTEPELEYFRKLLEELKAEYLETLGASLNSAKGEELDQQRIGRLSRMDAIQSQAIMQGANRRMAAELQQINLALERIQKGAYGTCMVCGRLIPRGRLEALPSATSCMGCAG